MTARLEIGDRVVFLSGPFQSMAGLVTELQDLGRVRVRLGAFGKEVDVVTRRDLLARESRGNEQSPQSP